MDDFNQLPNEGPKAYQAFMAYCEMGPDRSLSSLSKSIKKSKSLLSRWSAQYDWVYRASTYDKYLHERVMDEMAEERIENERQKAEIAKKFVEKAGEGLEDIDASKLKVSDRIRMISTGAKIERESRESLLELRKNKAANEQNKIIFEVVDSKGKRTNLSCPDGAEVIE
jgi:hypothetical protein